MASTEESMRGTAAIVTGASSGLGRAIALRLAAVQAHVALLGRSEDELAAVSEQVTSHGVRALPMPTDLANTDTLDQIVNRAADELGPLSVLVNAAATDAPGPAEHLSLDDWQRVVAVNLTAPFALARAAIPHMRRRGAGLSVNISSVAGRRGWANASAYCSTK